MLQGNLRRMRLCHEADCGLDARQVVRAVWMSGLWCCCCSAECSRELHRREDVSKECGEAYLKDLVPLVSGSL